MEKVTFLLLKKKMNFIRFSIYRKPYFSIFL